MKRLLLRLSALGAIAVAMAERPARAARPDDVLHDVEDIADLDISDLLGVVESASNMREARATAPAAVFVLSRDEILKNGSRSVPELLRSVPGLEVTYVAPGTTLVALRGLGGLQGNNLVVLVDGVRINSPVDGTVDWDHIAIAAEDLDRIEVVRGPVSAIYGSDAYTGVVSLITLRQKSEGFDGAAGIHVGADGQLDTTERAYAAATWKKGVATLTGSGKIDRDSTWAPPDDSEGPCLSVAAARVGLTLLTGQVETTARVDLATSKRDWIDHLLLDPTPTQSDEATAILGSRFRAYGWLKDIELETEHRVLRLESPEGFTPTGFTYAGTNALIGNYKLGAGIEPAHWLSLALDAEAGWEDVTAPYLHELESGVLRARYGGSGSARVEIGSHWWLSASGRADVTSRLPELTWSERASLSYVAKSYTIRGSVASAYREPSYVELGARLIDPSSNLILLEGAPDFRPPRLQSAEIGVIALPGRGFTVEPVVFLQRAKDLAVLDFEPLVKKTFRNDNDVVNIAGVELDVSWRVSALTTLFVRGHHFEWLDDRTDLSATVGVEEQNPATSAWLGGSTEWKDFEGRLEVGYVASRSFAAQAGIPPQILVWSIPALTPIDAAVHWRALDRQPLYLWARGNWQPQNTNEFPILAAGVPDVKVLVGVELRRAKD